MDEPTEGLAPAIVHDIVAMIRTIKEQGDTAILLVEQDDGKILGQAIARVERDEQGVIYGFSRRFG